MDALKALREVCGAVETIEEPPRGPVPLGREKYPWFSRGAFTRRCMAQHTFP